MSAPVAEKVRFNVVPGESAVLVEARSSVGPIVFGSMAAHGRIEAVLQEGVLDTHHPTTATLVIPVASLASGNPLYDAEVRSRLDARRYPGITAELRSIAPSSPGRYAVTGSLTIQGMTRELSGGLELSLPGTEVAVVTGTQTIDIRDFAIALPTLLMLKIYPDVTVRFRFQAVRGPLPRPTRSPT